MVKGTAQPKKKIQRRDKGPKAIELTIHLHKALHDTQFKKRANRAIKTIRGRAKKLLRTRDVRIDPQVNGYVWKNGIRNVPNRIRVRFERKINDKEDAKDKYFVEVKFLDVKSFHNLKSKRAEVSSK
ncbi:MAG: putative 60S ribosomal protein L31 [Streblomastix strix]|uniref:Putative 60S ribosomal protein L31 n=1 Tax=Streblomastix strix TaxID=222440 RepID=A0A5J4W2L7_9EUKA|nr:MAG: putative 60S ribosomal protein L31 [Streblomastix strix]